MLQRPDGVGQPNRAFAANPLLRAGPGRNQVRHVQLDGQNGPRMGGHVRAVLVLPGGAWDPSECPGCLW